MTKTALYPGSFDPLTNGHVNLLRGAFRLADRLVVAVGIHPAKKPMLTADDRIALIEEVAAPLAKEGGCELQVSTFDNLVVDFAADMGATILIRGLRDGSDLDFEMQMAGMNGTMSDGLQTVFLPASPDTRFITATLVRQIAGMGGDITPFVPPAVAERLRSVLKQS
jgi:pantetheine-phosphate adenylyltransferase